MLHIVWSYVCTRQGKANQRQKELITGCPGAGGGNDGDREGSSLRGEGNVKKLYCGDGCTTV